MKKLLLLLLVLTGMVTTASAAKTIYLVDNWGKSDITVYSWGGDNPADTWPGVSIGDATDFIDGCVYTINTGDRTDFIIAYNDGQTKDINVASDIENGHYYKFEWNDVEKKSFLVDLGTSYYTMTISATEDTGHDWSNFYLHTWDLSSGENFKGRGWPGITTTEEAGKYNFVVKSFSSQIGLLFHDNTGYQTCNLKAVTGSNNYYLTGITNTKYSDWEDSGYGAAVSTNGYGYSTFYTPVPLEIPTNMAYFAEDNHDGSATAHAITNPKKESVMLIKGSANTTYVFKSLSSDPDYSLSYTNAFFKGSGTGVAGGNGPYNYILKGDQFYLANGNVVAENKAYLQLTVAASASPLIFEDEISGINAITTVKAENGAYYNLQGVKVANPGKGLYIRNGKKFIVK